MIEHVDIKNFKCLRDVSLDLAPLTVLIGPNDSGKSSFLECLGLVSRALRSDDMTLDGRSIGSSLCWRCQNGVIQIAASASQRQQHYQIQIETWGAAISDTLTIGEKFVFRKSSPDEYGQCQIDFGDDCPPELSRNDELIADAQFSGWHDYVQRMNATLIDSPREHLADAFRSSAAFHLSAEQLRSRVHPTPSPRLAFDGRNLADVLHSIINGPDPEVRRCIDEQLHREIPALASVFTPVVEGANGAQLGIEFILNGDAKHRPRIPASQVSDGAMLITAFLALAYSDTPEILLIEEPENGLHPSRLKTVINLLRKMTTGEVGNRPRQVILTTHSPLLLNYVKPEEVRVFSRNGDEGTKVRSMSEVPGLEDLQKTYSTGEIWNLFGEETMFNEVAS